MEIFLVDDHDIIFSAYEALLKFERHKVVGTSTNGQGLIDFLKNDSCDIVFLDLSMPEMNGIDVLRKIYNFEKKPQIIMVSGNYHPDDIQKAFIQGASGFIDKNEIGNVIFDAIRDVSRKKKYISQAVLDKVLELNLKFGTFVTIESLLSKRQNEALKMMLDDYSNKEICKVMGIKSGTLWKMFQRIRDKLEVTNNIDLVKLSFKHNYNNRN